MAIDELTRLPDDARLWCFAADRELTRGEAKLLTDGLASFLAGWKAHAHELRVGFELREDRFLLVAVDESRAAASGCSIDSLVGRLRELEHDIRAGLIDGSAVWYRDLSGAVTTASRADFRRLAEQGAVGPDTPVFDLTLESVGQLRESRFEVPAAESWHARLFTQSGAGSAG